MNERIPLSESLRREAGPLWKTIHAHPFVTGIGDGTLPRDRFRYYMCQPYELPREKWVFNYAPSITSRVLRTFLVWHQDGLAKT